jgi:hypothetical protein
MNYRKAKIPYIDFFLDKLLYIVIVIFYLLLKGGAIHHPLSKGCAGGGAGRNPAPTDTGHSRMLEVEFRPFSHRN